MDSYSIEDIELLRNKSGLSYQEAVALLDYHNGDVARALIDLEKSGRLKDNQSGGTHTNANKTSGSGKDSEFKEKAINIFQKLYRKRIKVQKEHTPILNISVLFGVICLFFAPHITLAGIVLSMILGYKFSFTPMDADFSSDIEKMVRNAAQNAKNSVNSVVQNFKAEPKDSSPLKETAPPKKQQPAGTGTHPSKPVASATAKVVPETNEDPAAALKKQTEEIEKTMDSFFESNPAATTYRSAYSAAASSVPTLQVPVQAETREGTVEIGDDKDGYSSVTIG